jgi:hypothetical protein
MTTIYEFSCCECDNVIRNNNRSRNELFCRKCIDVQPVSFKKKLVEYRVVIEVDGEINDCGQNISVSGITSRLTVSKTKDDARNILSDFKKNPDYNTDFSVNKKKFPSGRYIDDWGYDIDSARIIAIEESKKLSSSEIKYRNIDKIF